MRKIDVIYLTGLGDHRPKGQDVAIKLFRLFAIKPHYFSVGWAQEDGFKERLGELSALINSIDKAGRSVALLAVSAGASAALNAFSQNKDIVSSVTLVCGKVNNLDKIDNSFYKNNPRFKESVDMLPGSLAKLGSDERSKIMSIRPVADPVVPAKDTIIEGARNVQALGYGHSQFIFWQITFGIPRIAWWIRKNAG